VTTVDGRDRLDQIRAAAAGLPDDADYVYLLEQLDHLTAERDRLQKREQAVRALCEKAEHGALRWADPLPVPEWVGKVRAALDGQDPAT
jgi:hypothetical protein